MNPTGNMSQMMISAGYGYGEGVVNNTTDTATYLVDRQTGAIFQTVHPDLLNPLSTEQTGRLQKMALAIEDHFGYPQDIEFSVTKGGEIVILQSRDITTIDLENIRILDNTNIVESYPGITRPLTFTFAKRLYGQVFGGTVRYFKPSRTTFQTLREPLSEMIALVQGRVYYQLHNWYKIIGAVTPSGNRMHEWEQFIGIRSSVKPTDKKQSVRRLRMTLIALSLLMRYPAIMRRFYRRFEKTYRPLRQQTDRFLVEHPDRQTIFQTYKAAEEGLVHCWPATLLNDFFVFRIYAALGRMVHRITGGKEGDVMQGLLCGISWVESELPVVEMLRLKWEILAQPEGKALFSQTPDEILKALDAGQFSTLQQRIHRYIDLYGDRTLEELKLEVPNFRQDRTGFIRMVQSQLVRENTLEQFRMQQHQIREAAETIMRENLRGKPIKRLAFKLLLQLTKDTVRNRENMRLRRTRAYGAVKELFLHAGMLMAQEGLIKAPTDVFMLDFEDLMRYLEHGKQEHFMEKVVGRVASYAAYEQQEMPDRIMYQGDSIPLPEGIREQTATKGVLTGLGISKGIVTAEAIVLDHPDYDAPVDGKILVSRSTDPGWVFLMTRAAGIVCEKGSPLSHTAIVGRELGIPVIVGVNNATRIISSGEIMKMDGARGEVTVSSGR
jgi:rifampicin phosphotransferase